MEKSLGMIDNFFFLNNGDIFGDKRQIFLYYGEIFSENIEYFFSDAQEVMSVTQS